MDRADIKEAGPKLSTGEEKVQAGSYLSREGSVQIQERTRVQESGIKKTRKQNADKRPSLRARLAEKKSILMEEQVAQRQAGRMGMDR